MQKTKNPTLIPNFLLFIPDFTQIDFYDYNNRQISRVEIKHIQSLLSFMLKVYNAGGGGTIKNVNNNQIIYLSKLLEWIEIERKNALMDARTVFPDDYKMYVTLSIWFDQVKEKVEGNPPEHYVKRVIVFENMEDGVTSVEYDYYPEEVTNIKEIAFIQRKRIKG